MRRVLRVSGVAAAVLLVLALGMLGLLLVFLAHR